MSNRMDEAVMEISQANIDNPRYDLIPPTINLGTNHTTETQSSLGNSPGKYSKTILAVDDEATMRRLYGAILPSDEWFKSLNLSIDLAENGKEGVNKFKENLEQGLVYPVVIMDQRMPVMDGRQAILEIQKSCKEKRMTIPAILVATGFGINELESYNVFYTLHKSFRISELSKIVKSAYESRISPI